MKHLVFICLVCQCGISAFGQEKSEYILFDEVHTSINMTNHSNENTDNEIGFGIGATRNFSGSGLLNIAVGASYEQVRLFRKFEDGRRSESSFSDVTYRVTRLSIPVILRANMRKDKKVKLFSEVSVFSDFLLSANRKGTFTRYTSNEIERGKFSSKVELDKVNLGGSFGFGVLFSFETFGLYVKPDYKLSFLSIGEAEKNVAYRYFRISLGIKRVE